MAQRTNGHGLVGTQGVDVICIVSKYQIPVLIVFRVVTK